MATDKTTTHYCAQCGRYRTGLSFTHSGKRWWSPYCGHKDYVPSVRPRGYVGAPHA